MKSSDNTPVQLFTDAIKEPLGCHEGIMLPATFANL